ncbi:MAG: hypothetical protein WBP45_13020 [Daejeonella sp.]
MFIFPIIYFSSFLLAVKELIQKNKEGVLLFLIFGLPIYTTSLSIVFQTGFRSMLPLIQSSKEVIVLIMLGISIWELKRKIKLQLIDYLVFAYLVYTLLYVFLPIGQYGFFNKLLAFKSSTFFVFIYLAGRLLNISEIYISKYFHYILLVAIAATLLLAFEKMNNQHFQTLTGYADLNYYYFNQEPTGNYDLSWTFETSTGLKRFASFFSSPLEYAAATLLSLAVIMGLYTTQNNKIKLDTFGIIALISTQLAIFFAISRASLISYFIMVYLYAWITRNRNILNYIHIGLIAVILYFIFFLFFINPDLYEFIYETVTFTNPSSLAHVIAWLEGIEAMISNPLGLGLGESGRFAGTNGESVGGENQFIIIGVQTGIFTLLLYLAMQIYIIKTCWVWYPKLSGKNKKVCLTLLFMKVGLIIPMLTSEIESSVYISYITWFLSGVFVNIIAGNRQNGKILRHNHTDLQHQ